MFSLNYNSCLEQNHPNNLTIVVSTIVSSLALLIFILPGLVLAQTSCGDFIETYYGIDERMPIEDCDDPFGLVRAESVRDFNYQIYETVLVEGEVLDITELPVTLTLPESESLSGYNNNSFQLYRHEGDDLRLVDMKFTNRPSLVSLVANATGTYSIVTIFDSLFSQVRSEKSWWQKLFTSFVPVAQAQSAPGIVMGVLTFTLAEEVASSDGVSSILFLPGIQASRLYKDGLFGTEDQLWEPNINQDVSQLAMTESGQSINDIYTKDVIDEVFGVSNIYKSLLEQFEDMKNEEIIADYLSFAYDWRYNVHDIAYGGTKHANDFVILVDELVSLADSSYSGKVTIVAHSNGGLLAKALITELNNRGLANLVDKVIFVATPHLGTPKAIATILHGYDQQRLGGAIIDDETVRSVVKNMPGVYSLLPSAKYLDIFGEPLITFGEGEVTEQYRTKYGESINTFEEYVEFLKGEEGRIVESGNVSNPSTANADMLDWALSDHASKLDNWSAPEGIEVHNIVGVGLKTVKSLEYRELQEYITCSSNIFGQITCDEPVHFIRPYAHFTQYGDETVTSLSATEVTGKTYYFDFSARDENTITAVDREHSDITEVDEIRFLIDNIINSTTTSVDYVTLEIPIFNQEYEILSVDSPVRMVAEDNEGNKTGVIVKSDGTKEVRKEIPGSEYLEFAGTKYLITPKNTDNTVTLYGEDYGGFTLIKAILDSNDVQEIETEMINATTTPNMVATFSRKDGVDSSMEIDINGDGAVDYQTDLNGNKITTEDQEISFSALRSQIDDLELKHRRKAALLVLLTVSEKAYERSDRHRVYKKIADRALESLSQLVKKYERLNWLSEEVGNALEESIIKLRDNIM